MDFYIKEQKNYTLVLISISLFARILFFQLAETTDADAVTRTLISHSFANQPFNIQPSSWLPLQFVISGWLIHLLPFPEEVCIFVSIICSVLSSWIIYKIILSISNSNVSGLFAGLSFSFSPIVFRNSLMAMSEPIFVFLILLSLYSLFLYFQNNRILLAFCFVLFWQLAQLIRYEAWILSMPLIFILYKQFPVKTTILLILSLLIIPFTWLWFNLVKSEIPVNPFSWATIAVKENYNVGFDLTLRRVWSFPFSLLIACGPLPLYFWIKNPFNKNTSLYSKVFILFFVTSFLFLLIGAQMGFILLQHRFIQVPFLFLLLYIFNEKFTEKFKPSIVLVSLLFTFFISFAYNTYAANPLPRLKDRTAVKFASDYLPLNKNCHLIIDVNQWEAAYYFALKSKLLPQNITINHPDTQLKIDVYKIKTENSKNEILFIHNYQSKFMMDHIK